MVADQQTGLKNPAKPRVTRGMPATQAGIPQLVMTATAGEGPEQSMRIGIIGGGGGSCQSSTTSHLSIGIHLFQISTTDLLCTGFLFKSIK
jgi:hypothetical protein